MTGRAAVNPLAGGHVIVADLGYGDAGKGSVVDWLCARAPGPPVTAVVRFNGGAQAAHNVVATDGRHHTFAQFGSGMFTPRVRTHLSRFTLVDPLALAAEAAHLAAVGVADPLGRITVDRDALLTTPYHAAANRARERARGAGRHGSCGMGIGETAAYALRHPDDAPRAGDCDAPRALARKLTLLRDRLAADLAAPGADASHPDASRPDASHPDASRPGRDAGPDRPLAGLPPVGDLCDAYRAFAGRVRLTGHGYLGGLLRQGRVVFEGAQGVLLDEWHGFHPYTTWSTTTFANAQELLAEAGATAVRLGVIRSYLTRHGPGPLVTEDPTLELSEPHNGTGPWQGPFRAGHFDTVAFRYAIEAAGGADAVALTHLDAAWRAPLRLATGYVIDGERVERLPVHRDHDLERQQRLTSALLRATPVYAGHDGDWLAITAQVAGAPVALVSRGPTAADKVACMVAPPVALPTAPPAALPTAPPAALPTAPPDAALRPV